MARRHDGDGRFMFFSCLFVLINTVVEWNVWRVEKKLELHQVIVWIWFAWAIVTTHCCIVFIRSSVVEYFDRNMSRREHVSSAVKNDETIAVLHDTSRIVISTIILLLYVKYYSCTNQSKPTPAADGSDGLETVRAICWSNIASSIKTVYHCCRKMSQSDNSPTCDSCSCIIICNISIFVFTLWLLYVGVC